MKKWWLAVLMGSVLLAQMPEEALAKRLGGGGSSGMKRAVPTQPAQRTTPDSPSQSATPAKPNQAQQGTAAAGAAAAPKRNWMGPIAGLAAGLGIAALMSHFGMGGALANFMTMALLAVAAVFVIGWLMRRFGKSGKPARSPFAMAGAGAGNADPAMGSEQAEPNPQRQRTLRRVATCQWPSILRSTVPPPTAHACRPTLTSPLSSAWPA
jgi:predicted lipid-binding transport protein (Tim44 family)